MAKRSRRPLRNEPLSTSEGESTRSADATSSRSSRPRPRRAVAQPSFIDRYRTLIYGGAALIGVVIIAWLFLSGPAQAGYTCDSELTPGPSESITPGLPTATPSPTPSATPSPAITLTPSGSPVASPTPTAAPSPTATATAIPAPTPRLGFLTSPLGRTHVVDPNTVINYAFCPPTSGEHYNIPGRGPIRPAVYPANQEQVPGGWIHNMEHGYIVALYRCPSGVIGQGECITQAEFEQMQAFWDQVPDSGNPSCPTRVVVARFDSMTTRFALLAWNRALLTDEFDLDTALLFDQQWQDQIAAPERGSC